MKPIFENKNNYNDIPIVVTTQPNLNNLAHWHADVEFILVFEGPIQMGINTESRLLEAGDMAICISNDIHYFVTKKSSSTLVIKFLPELIDGSGSWQKHHFVPPFIQKKFVDKKNGLKSRVYEDILELFRALVHERQRQNDYFTIVMKGKLLELCGMFLRHLPKEESESALARSSSGIRLVQAAVEYMEQNYMHSISLDDISKTLNVSPHYFSRIFNKTIGMNLKTYQNQLRLNKAESMILTENAAITDIAYECGFNSIRTFNRCFRLVKGYTPTDLRKTSVRASP
ncbi:helix-turn-helix domain-containing protein [Paenibacillus sepulcri]|uniref:AraC family transcriptional regulator n=1 Tax=Paenibacillus sepulcri TaxID=359917 RepID=A0ABS7BWE6_9BACL|nr:AraC family transcriptional regulator [Paenibacillus sepulcri]